MVKIYRNGYEIEIGDDVTVGDVYNQRETPDQLIIEKRPAVQVHRIPVTIDVDTTAAELKQQLDVPEDRVVTTKTPLGVTPLIIPDDDRVLDHIEPGTSVIFPQPEEVETEDHLVEYYVPPDLPDRPRPGSGYDDTVYLDLYDVERDATIAEVKAQYDRPDHKIRIGHLTK